LILDALAGRVLLMKLEAPAAPSAFYDCPGPVIGTGADGAVFRDTLGLGLWLGLGRLGGELKVRVGVNVRVRARVRVSKLGVVVNFSTSAPTP